MRIAVLADTHLPRFGRALPESLVAELERERIEHILHCGDWTEPFVAGLLEAIAPLDGVAGNNDGDELRARFGDRRVIELAGVRIGLTHGHLGRPSLTTPERARAAFADETGLDAICFGHSHVPLVERSGSGPLLVNPGSPTDKRWQPRHSWALLELVDGRLVRAAIRQFDR